MALPGVRTTILDRFYNLGRTDLPAGPTLALIAKRSTNPAGSSPDVTPYFASGELDVITEFGENSHIHRAYKEASTAGAGRIYLIPLPSNAVFTQATGGLTSAGFTGGDLFDAAFAAAESVQADIIVPWGAGSDSTVWDDVATPATPGGSATDFFYADNVAGSNSWLTKVANKCAEITANSYPCFAVMGVKPIVGREFPTPQELATGVNFATLTSRDTVTTGHFVSVVAAEFTPIGYPSSWGFANGAATYAALASRLEPWRALTGKPVYNVDKIRYNVTRTQAEALNNKGVVTAAIDFSGSLKWVDATTFAPAVSDFTRLSTLRIAFDAVKVILRVAERYKGENMSLSAQNAFDTEIGSRLRSMQQIGALTNSDYRIRFDPSMNRALVDLAISPAFELREIVLTVSINFG